MVIKKFDGAYLIVEDSLIIEVGIHNLLRDKGDLKIKNALKVIAQNPNSTLFERDYTINEASPPNGFLNGLSGTSRIVNCKFNSSVTIMGLFRVSGGENLYISGTSFDRIIGQDQASIVFIVQNL